MEKSKNKHPEIRAINVVVDCADAGALADFYSKLLHWPVSHPYADGWAAITSPQGAVMAFQEVPNYQPPVWPWQPGKQGQMLHLDFWVDDLAAGVAHAIACGATEAGAQYYTTSRTLLDPAGHPFCIDTSGEEPE